MKLSSKQRALLKKMAHDIEPVVRIGKGEVDSDLLDSISNVINKRELIKVKVLQNSDVEDMKELGIGLAEKTSSVFVDKIGKVIILFKPKKENGVITQEILKKRKGK
ncbi:YhbY family RNA-binding protein [Sebaldella sp. S0638]|uniref:YhbY family RNA-binding protein n=1 Tax=Sebaldella sp. S0638 TaxID=2957809 RepID=UPI00209C7A35|nr:YhbY family RNA-binding protein [Sebaldella sp. S0638]MCP1223961.1 YhbY family RNA-binding protein [Sebaldella sp. S0638]